MYVGDVDPRHRGRVEEILKSTGLFHEEEVQVALELFDEGLPDGFRTAMPDYLLLGVFADDHRLVGWAAYGPTPATDRAFDLYWIAVDRAAQGTGAGTMLLGAVEERLRALGARLLLIETSARTDYAATRGFYASRGYEEAARVGAFYAPDDDRVILTKRFPNGPGEGRGVLAS